VKVHGHMWKNIVNYARGERNKDNDRLKHRLEFEMMNRLQVISYVYST